MPLQTFSPPRAPSFQSQKSVQPRILKASFGDGYTQRTADGLNTMPQSWDLRWDALRATDADAIEAFFVATGGYKAFWWTPFDQGSPQPLKFIVESWTKAPVGTRVYSVSAKLTQVFDL
ncbi:phage tail protein [Azospirillum canadense]|uniref:phage tail protein n=1 Tax=Azospirillum canadense TaxID=403962 RepID=UPI002227A3B4|nr:phage tail protein [Azospirillum canadense]MCW2242269.1 phage-related protein [Azospirillum canadense]